MGCSVLQRSVASGQRGGKWHPAGGLSGEGTSPLNGVWSFECLGLVDGLAASNARVYGWAAFLFRIFVGAVSTIWPKYITAVL